MREDHYTTTVEDAARYEQARGEDHDTMDTVDRPSRGEAQAEADERYAEMYHAGPANVAEGIRCAHCKARHETVAEIRWCADLQAEARAEALAEQAAEARAERYFEEGPESFAMLRAAEEDFDRARAWNDPWA